MDAVTQAHKNLKLIYILKIFTKRVFFPIVPIYLMTYLHFSIQEIGLVSVLFSLVSILTNVPAGYFADRFGRANSLRLMAIIEIIATLCYFFAETKLGVVVAITFEAIGYAFYIGAGEALVHDSLELTKQEKNYTKVVARAQSFALIINAVLVALIPMTYALSPKLPFLFGTVAFSILLITALNMNEVLPLAKREKVKKRLNLKGFELLLKHYKIALFAILLGIIGALYYSFDIFTIALKQFGMNPEFVGWVFAGASLLGALLGLGVHYLKRLSITAYMVLDVCVLVLPFIAIYTANLSFMVIAIMLFMAFWRFRKVIYQHHAFERFSTRYKSTLISALFMMEDIQGLWIPIALTSSIAAFGMSMGMGYGAIVILLIGAPFVIFGQLVFGQSKLKTDE